MRTGIAATALLGWFSLIVLAGLAHGQGDARGVPSRPGGASSPGLLAGKLPAPEAAAFEARFAREIWPLMERAGSGCVACHNRNNPSQLQFSPEGAGASFKRLLSQSFFDPENPAGILARVLSSEPEQRMPPAPAEPWGEAEVRTLRTFVTDLYDRTHRSGGRADELFPPELLDPYTRKSAGSGHDNTFLSFRQLRGKIKTLFNDDWIRGEQDLFLQNVSQFGGADFMQRFDESAKPAASYLSALDRLSRDAASRAYLSASGPFAGRTEGLPDPRRLDRPDAAYRREITRLYRRLLYRVPTEAEIRQSFAFLRNVYAADRSLPRGGHLDFELEVTDGAGMRATRAFRIPVDGGALGLYQEFVDQSQPAESAEVRKTLERTFHFKPDTPGQRFEIGNARTSGNVSLAAVELKGPLPAGGVRRIDIRDPSVRLHGAWQRRDDGFPSYEDGNNNKGSSRIEIPINPPAEGRYAITVTWRKSGTTEIGRGRRAVNVENAASVPVEVFSQDPSALAAPPLPPVPPEGEAHFTVDQTVDTLAYWNLQATFRFTNEPGQGVEVRNHGTRKRVVADSVKFEPAEGGEAFVLDDPEAEGGWPRFVFPSFRPFNLVGGGAVTDNNEKKGEMALLYRPAKSARWSESVPYRVYVGFPGQLDNDTRVPVVVRARASTPIIQMSGPFRAAPGSRVTVDASATYSIQRSPLRFSWTQVGGPRVRLADSRASRIAFTVEPMTAQQAAWEGLCQALMKHPDFLFTRPRSLVTVSDPKERRRLQLVKISQDLVGRPPTEAEVALLERGAPLSRLIDGYLSGQEFRDFYFHRIRLVLESRGSEEDDEPVRLWSYVAFQDRPFKEILTADYTVDTSFRKQPRPSHYGKTGLLTMKGFVKGKPGLPHFNYAAIVTEKFLGYVYEVPPSIVMMRDGITAASTTSPTSVCFSCHKILTPLAYQRMAWDDEGNYRPAEDGAPVDDTDRGLVPTYPYRGKGMEAFSTQAVNKERFIRTMFQTHFVMFFGREMRYQEDERALYKRLWDEAAAGGYTIRGMLRSLLTSPEYLYGRRAGPPPSPAHRSAPGKKPRAPVRKSDPRRLTRADRSSAPSRIAAAYLAARQAP